MSYYALDQHIKLKTIVYSQIILTFTLLIPFSLHPQRFKIQSKKNFNKLKNTHPKETFVGKEKKNSIVDTHNLSASLSSHANQK